MSMAIRLRLRSVRGPIAFAALSLLAAAPRASDPDPCTLITTSEAAAAMGTPSKPGEVGRFLPSCTYAADLPATDPRARINQVFVKIEDESQFQSSRAIKTIHTENVAVGDDAYYFWSGQNVISGVSLAVKRHGTFVLIVLNAWAGAKDDSRSISVAEIKQRELVLAGAAVKRIP
jgi:hypothetical protein